MLLLLLTSSLLFVLSSNNNNSIFTLAKIAKKKLSLSSPLSSPHTTTTSKKVIKTTKSNTSSLPSATVAAKPNPLQHIHDTTNFQAISQNLIAAATNDNAITNPSQCNSHLNDFILPAKEARFIILDPCITVSGTVVWTNYFNADGDANFNVVLDPQYKDMLGPGQFGQEFFLKYNSGAALHVEVPCQGPVTSLSPLNVGACDSYDGPNFKPVLPSKGNM